MSSWHSPYNIISVETSTIPKQHNYGNTNHHPTSHAQGNKEGDYLIFRQDTTHRSTLLDAYDTAAHGQGTRRYEKA